MRHRLNRAGERRLHSTLHRAVINRRTYDPETRNYVAKHRAQDETDKEIRFCVKRYLARRIFIILSASPQAKVLQEAASQIWKGHHQHSGIGFHIPANVHYGFADGSDRNARRRWQRPKPNTPSLQHRHRPQDPCPARAGVDQPTVGNHRKDSILTAAWLTLVPLDLKYSGPTLCKEHIDDIARQLLHTQSLGIHPPRQMRNQLGLIRRRVG